MSLTFLKGSKILFDVNGTGFEINPGVVSIDQTFQETNYSAKTLQDRNMVQHSIVQKKASATFSFDYYLSANNLDDEHILQWFGLTKSTNTYILTPVIDAQPVKRDFYLNTIDGKKIKVSDAVMEVLDLDVRHDTIAKITVTGSARLMEIIDAVPALSASTYTGPLLGNKFIVAEVAGIGLQGIIANKISISKTIEWLDQPTIHSSESGEIYIPTIPIITELSVSGRFTVILKDNDLSTHNSSIKISSGKLEVYLDNCNVSERLGLDQVFGKTLDFKLQPNIITKNSYIKYT